MSRTEIAQELFALAEESSDLEAMALFTLADYVSGEMSAAEQNAVRDAIVDAAGRYFHEEQNVQDG